MTTTHQAAADAALETFLCDPEGGRALQTYRDGIRTGRYGSLRDVIHQHWQDAWPAEQLACFARVYSEICAGDVAQVQISAAGAPMPDAERAANASLVSDLPGPFTAEVYEDQNCEDQDGMLRWAVPIQIEVSTGRPLTGPDGTIRPEITVREIPPGCAPLEIGTTNASNTLMHLRRNRAVARWPYGHDRIRLLVAIDEPWQRRAGL